MRRARALVSLTSALVIASAVAGCGAPSGGPDSVSPPAQPAVSPSPVDTGSASGVDDFKSPRSYREVAEPVRIRIPSQGISSKLVHVGLAADGTVEAPTQWSRAAWYDRGPRPGQQGAAVIVGHVDSKSHPAVFFRLNRLKRGDHIFVDQADGRTARFTVTTQRQFPKSAFPADLVYSNTLATTLQLLTCGGTFDRTSGHYRDNVVVSAVQA